jgi:hypothetical protein
MRVFEHAVVPTASPSAAWREQIPGLPEDQIPLLMGKKSAPAVSRENPVSKT